MTYKTGRLAALSTFALGSSLVTGLIIPSTSAADAQSAQPGVQIGAADSDTNAPALEEVVVTAQRRSEKMVDVPISITALGPQQLATANVQNLGDIAQLTPSLRFDNQAGFFQPTIRGIGTGVTTSGGGSNVGIYIDGFYSPNPLAADFQLTNVTSVQVLKGPQGTLFGHNTTGGAILVTTADPSTDAHAEAKVSYGSFNAERFQGYVTGGIGAGVALDIEGLFSKGNGFLTNILDDDNHVGAYDNYTVRAGLKAEIGDKVSVVAHYTHSRENDPTAILTNSNTDTSVDPTTGKPWGLQTQGVPGFYTTNPNQVADNLPTFITSATDIAQVTVKADLDFANLTSYSQWRREDVNQSEDLDQTGLPIFQLGLPIFDRTISQEFILTSKPGPRLQWTAGAFFFTNTDTYVTYIDNGVETVGVGRIRLGGSSSTTENYAGYLDATYEVMPQLFVTAGARVSHDIVKDAYYNTAFTSLQNPEPGIDSNKVTPRVVVRYKPTDESSVYASFTEGYKAAIIDVGGSCQIGPAFACNNVKPEEVNAFEVGYKFEQHGFSTQAAAFYYDYKDLQVSEFLGAAQAAIINAAQSQIYGLEDELHFDLNNHLQLNAGASWTHARYKTFGTVVDGVVVGAPIYATCANATAFPPGACGPGNYDYVNTSTILHDVHMQHVPDFTATVGPRFTTGMTATGEYSFSGNLYYTSSYFNSPSGTQFFQPGYTTLALRAAWKDSSQRYSVALYGDNVTNERYRTQVQYNSFGIGAAWSAPATWGVELGAKF
jgi:iron complex outermembrane receptor protein